MVFFNVNKSKQLATGSNDSMVYVWNLNQSGNIYKFLGHRVWFFFIKRMQLQMYNFHP